MTPEKWRKMKNPYTKHNMNIEQCENLRTAEGEQRANLIKFIDKSMAEIKALTPDTRGPQ